MFTDTELKDFIQKHETEILNNDWESIYDDLPSYKDVPKLTDFLLNKAHINPLYYMTSVPECFARELDITSITIPSSVTTIGSSAFSNCSWLTSIIIPRGVRSIGGYAFYACIRLTSITIANGVTEIGYHAFAGCTNLTSVTIPSSVKRIRDYAFGGCSKLNEINYTGTQRQWDKLLSLAKSRDFANWIRENKVKIIFI